MSLNIIKETTYCESLKCFSFKYGNKLLFSIKLRKRFGTKQIKFYVEGEQQSCINVFVLLGITPFHKVETITNTVCKDCVMEITLLLAQTFYSKTFNSE